jgi:hypothetical protein
VQAVIADGLAEVAAVSGNIRLSAFRLHEVIEQVRADLKAVWKAAKTEAAALSIARVTGVVTVGGKPVPHARVEFAGPGGDPPVSVGGGADGEFSVTLPPGEYAVTATGATTPASPLVVQLHPGNNTIRIDLP